MVYSDNSLLPREAVRLAALGLLADRPLRYAELAREVRHFTSRFVGPSLELIGAPIELLRYEGLIEADGDGGDDGGGGDSRLRVTESGRAELVALLESPLRAPINDVSKLVLALKMRFLHLLDPGRRREQLDMAIEACRIELARLVDLERHHAGAGDFADWLAHDIGLVRARLDWLEGFRAALQDAGAGAGGAAATADAGRR